MKIGKLHQINYAVPLYKEKAGFNAHFLFYLKDLEVVTILDIKEDASDSILRIRILTDKGNVGWIIMTQNTVPYSICRI